MKNTNRFDSLAFTIVAALSLASCSSANDSSTANQIKPPASGSISLQQDGNALVAALSGNSIEVGTENALLIGETIVVGGGAGAELESGSFSVDGRTEAVSTSTMRIQYDCPLGGTVIADTGVADLGEPDYSNFSTHTQYEFDQCRIETQGEQLLTGSVRTLAQRISASHGQINNNAVQWINFTWQIGGGSYLDGTALIETRGIISNDSSDVRVVSIDRFEKYENDQPVLTIAQASMNLNSGIEGNGVINSFYLNTQGMVTNATGVPVQVNTQQPLTARLVTSLDYSSVAEAFAGTLDFSADDGSSLTLTAQPIVEIGPLLMDSNYTSGSGEISQQTAVEFVPPTVINQE